MSRVIDPRDLEAICLGIGAALLVVAIVAAPLVVAALERAFG